jgi:hypothetical protein
MATTALDRPTPKVTKMPEEHPFLRRLATGNVNLTRADEQQACAEALVQQLGLRMSSMPIKFLKTRNGEIQPYLTASGAADIMISTGASVTDVQMTTVHGCAICRSTILTRDNRTGVATGAVALDGLRGEALANAFMKAETKSVRRNVLRTCRPDAVWLIQDEDIEGIEGAKRLPEVIDQPAAAVPQTELPEPAAKKPQQFFAENVVVLSTAHVPKPLSGKPPHWEITLKTTTPFEPERVIKLAATAEPIYQLAAEAEGTGSLFRATWVKRSDGQGDGLLTKLEPEQ